MLTLALSLALLAEPAEFAAPKDRIGCFVTRHELLGPQANDSGKVPTNASIWLRENPSAVSQTGVDPRLTTANGDPIDVETIATTTRLGVLIQLRPRALLAPGTRYRIHTDLDTVDFTTAAGTDLELPTTPQVSATGVNDDGCTGMGIEVGFTHDAGGEPMLYLAEGSADDLYNLMRTSPIYIPAAEGEEIQATVIAMDLAGNRSIPSLLILEQNRRGCGCATNAERSDSSSWMLPLFAFGVWLLVRALTEKRI